MKYLSIDEVVAIQFELIKQFGGSAGVHDFGLLHSAIERPKATFGGEDLYPTVFEKAAALLHSLILNHPFIDGNKRTAYVSTARFLQINGYELKTDKDSLIKYLLEIEKNKSLIKNVSQWIRNNSRLLK